MRHPVIEDQYTVARVYFVCIIGLLLIESLIHLPSYFRLLRTRGEFENH